MCFFVCLFVCLFVFFFKDISEGKVPNSALDIVSKGGSFAFNGGISDLYAQYLMRGFYFRLQSPCIMSY